MAKRSFLVIGSGGREHALAWKLSQSPDRPCVFVAPGNDGVAADTAIIGGNVTIAADDFKGLATFARDNNVLLTIVGPEGPLCSGVVDYFEARDLKIFGPNKAAAHLEGSKAFAKTIMCEAQVPTAEFQVFDTFEAALAHVEHAHHPLVIKADGLAAGKGVVISASAEESQKTLERFMAHRLFGEASTRVVIEECLVGPELSYMAIVDGEHILALATSQDHKRVGEGDTGPNTGGMGAFTPSPHGSRELENEIIKTVLRPILKTLRDRGISYRGFLYAGLMLTEAGPRVLEFNVRMGDPETQALLFALHEEVDLGEVLVQATDGTLQDGFLPTPYHAHCIVLASRGYPGTPEVDHLIEGLDVVTELPDTHVFHAATRRDDEGHFLTTGGRVLGVTARGSTVEQARRRAYDAVAKISWEGMHYRRDL